MKRFQSGEYGAAPVKRMKNIEISILSGLLIALLLGATAAFASGCDTLRQGVVRLHILANSNQPADQQLKLEVRDAILARFGADLSDCGAKDEAQSRIGALLPEIEETAREVLRENGFDEEVRAKIVRMYFDTRSYGSLTMPAGMYDALRVTIGKAEGHNWWCVLYPPVCVSSAADLSSLSEETVAGENPRLEPRFKIVEWIESAKQKLEAVRGEATGSDDRESGKTAA